jgi:hypothetical protein
MSKGKVIMVWTVVLVSILGLAAAFLFRYRVGSSRLEVRERGEHFPVVSGYNLQREEYQFPRDFAGKWNLVIVPFERVQQQDVNTWIPALQELERQYPDFIYYELPTIYRLPTLSRTFINEGMRAGIPDPTARERTITLYLDKERFKQAVGIESEENIHLLLVDRQGRIRWRARGIYAADVLNDLEGFLRDAGS